MKLLTTIALSLSLATLGGCKKDANTERSEKAGEELKEAREDVTKAAEKVAEERKDVTEENKDVAQARNDLAQAQTKADEARGEFVRAAQVQIDSMNARLKEAEAKWGAKGKERIVVLRTQVTDLEKIRDDAQANAANDLAATQAKFAAAVQKLDAAVNDAARELEKK
jgi:hypothetical protein